MYHHTAQLKEFGFSSEEAFPMVLRDHAVSVSLSQARKYETVVVPLGLMIPLDVVPGQSLRGLVIRDDGCLLRLSRQDGSDGLNTTFVREIPFDLRSQAVHVMRRASQIDGEIAALWATVRGEWLKWYPASPLELDRNSVGEFDDVQKAWQTFCEYVVRWAAMLSHRGHPDDLIVQVVVEREVEYQRGWMGKEQVAFRDHLKDVKNRGVEDVLKNEIGTALKEALADPVFHPKSHFRILHEKRHYSTIKWVIVPPGEPEPPGP